MRRVPTSSDSASLGTTRATATSRLERSASLVAAGLPTAAQQFRIRLRTKLARIDLAYPEQKIAIELDSWEFHGRENRTAFTVDRATSNDLLVIGWAPTQFTPDMSDEYFVDTIRRLWPDECSRSGAA